MVFRWVAEPGSQKRDEEHPYFARVEESRSLGFARDDMFFGVERVVRWRMNPVFLKQGLTDQGLFWLGLICFGCIRQAAEAAFAALVLADCFQQVLAAEVGPVALGYVYLRVSDLPEQEIAYAHFSAGADDQVRVGHMRGVEGIRNVLFSQARQEGIEWERAVVLRCNLSECAANGVDDFSTRAVIESERERGAGVALGLLGGPAHGVLNFIGQLGDAADVGDADVVVVHPPDVGYQIGAQQAHEEADFRFRPAKAVLKRKGVEGQPGKIDAGCSLDDVLHGLGTLLMAEEALETPKTRPSAISIHNDGDVFWQPLRIELPKKSQLLRRKLVQAAGWGNRRQCKIPQLLSTVA
jgi:hypothetical protein